MEKQWCLAKSSVVRVSGRDAVDLLHRLSTNDLTPLKSPGAMVRTIFTTAQGKLVDWAPVVSTDDGLLVVTSPGRAQKLCDWIANYTIMEDVTCEDVSAHYQLALCNWKAPGLLGPGQVHQAASGLWFEAPEGMGSMALVPDAAAVASEMGSAGAQKDDAWVQPLRVELGIPSPEFEFHKDINPLEIRLKPYVNWHKGCYIGQEVISRLDSYDKLARWLMGFESEEAVENHEGLRIVRDGKSIGRVTSVFEDQGCWKGLAIVERAAGAPGEAHLNDENKTPVKVCDRPFWT